MKIVFDTYSADDPIPVQRFIKNRKLVKYFNRETAAALVAAGKLIGATPLEATTPFYYETGVMEHESLGLDAIAANSIDDAGCFDPQRFVNIGVKAVPPLTQFKALYNMPLSFVAIEHGLCGDNAVIYASARGLILQALCAPMSAQLLLGCGKVYADAHIECAFALLDSNELDTAAQQLDAIDENAEAIELFRSWCATYGTAS
jgi:hypothetical protein